MRLFENYHRHSHLSNPKISDCVVKNFDYAKRAVELGHTIISTMEHGYQGRYIEGYELSKKCVFFDKKIPECEKCGGKCGGCPKSNKPLKFVFGAEAYWVKDRTEKDRSNCHIFIGAKNENGRQSINEILSEANITGFYSQSRIDIPLIMSLPKDDVIITSACVGYWKYEDIETITKDFADKFGKSFFLEVQYHNTPEQRDLNSRILKLHDRYKIPLIMGCDSHYIFDHQAQNRTDFLISKGLNYPDEEGWYLDYPDGDTAYQRFANQTVLSHSQICDAMDNTHIFREVKEYDNPIFNTEIKMPSLYPDWTQEQKDNEYKRLVWQGWDSYKKEIDPSMHDHYESEIQKEIDVVVDTFMSDYFIDNYHIIKKGKENGGWITKSGRGSAVSFITNMLLGFTDVDRIAAKVKMYPERFMSTTRILQSGSLPDIDFNLGVVEPFARGQREVLGEDHAAPMISFGTMQKSKAWKLYAKSQGIPFEIANEVSEQLKKYEMAVKHAEEDEKDDIDVQDYIGSQYKEIFEKSQDYLGLIDSWSIAPCSYLLYAGSIRKEIGLIKVKENLCCLMDGHWAEDYHFLKNDLLKVSTVDLMYRTFRRLGMNPPSVNELLKLCPPDDPAWDVYKKGCTLGINQVEKPGTSSRVGVYKPTNISELCAFVAAIRPGFKSMYKIFESRKPFSYNIKAFDNLLQTEELPFSFCLYQEQEMAVLNYAGIDMSDCYTAIKNIAKKRVDKVLAYKTKFIDGFKNTIINDEHRPEQEADELTPQLWQIIEDSSRYSFNASHSYCVSIDSLYCAWLKAHHPLEFYETLLIIHDEKGDKDKMMAIKEEAENYFDIKFPPFRFGQDNRSIRIDYDNKSINNTISAIKGFGSSVGELLYECGLMRFTYFYEILRWLDERSFKSSKVDTLIKIDYFQQFGNNKELLRIMELWDFLAQGTAKNINKAKLTPELIELIAPYSSDKGVKGNVLKSYCVQDMESLLISLEKQTLELKLPDFEYREKARNQLECLGYVDLTTGKQEDRRKLYILDTFTIDNKFRGGVWKHKLKTKSLGSGKVASLDISPTLMKKNPLYQGDIILAEHVAKDDKGYWQLFEYQKLK